MIRAILFIAITSALWSLPQRASAEGVPFTGIIGPDGALTGTLSVNPEDLRGPPGPAGPAGPPGPAYDDSELREMIRDLQERVTELEGKDPPDPPDPPPSEDTITPQQFGALCNGTADDSAAIDAWLNELAHRSSLVGLVPKDSHCRAPNVVDRNLEVDTHLVIEGTLDLANRKVGWGVNTANFTIEGKGRVTCEGGIAFITSPRNDYDFDSKGKRFGDFNPRMTRDIDQLQFKLAEWDGCTPYMAATYHPTPKSFDEELSRFRVKRFFFDGWVHDAPLGPHVVAYKWGDADAMEIEDGEIVSGAPAFEVRGRLTNIRAQPGRKSGYAVRAVFIGSGRKGAKDTNGGLLVSIACEGVYNDGFQQNATEGNETQCLRIEAGEDILVADSRMKDVRWPGKGTLESAEAKLDSWGKPVSNTECLYTKADKLWVVRTIFENCDGTGFDAMAWTDKGYGSTHGRDLTVRWTRPEWNRVFCRSIRLNTDDQTGILDGIAFAGHDECAGFTAKDRARRYSAFGPSGVDRDRFVNVTGIPHTE